MKFLFILPRFHTNQFQIVKSLIEINHDVEIFVQYFGKSEDHSIVKPSLIKKSILSTFIFRFLDLKYDTITADKKKMKYFIPSQIDLFRQIKKCRPDVVILRNPNLTAMCAYFICRLTKIKARITYNQTPLYSSKNVSGNVVKTFLRKIIREYISPKVGITPVYTNNISKSNDNMENYYISKYDYFVPFIAEVNEEVANRGYCFDEKINILDVGKYRDYKNHFLLVDAINLIEYRRNLKVTIVGQVVNKEEQKYYDSLKTYIRMKNLNDVIRLEKNVEYSKMGQIYRHNDIFVLASKVESASIAVLEAMASGMVTISTDANGTASYIVEGECGYIFKTMDAKDLAAKIKMAISDKSNIQRMGKNSFLNIKKNFTFRNYYLALGEVLKKEFGITIHK